MDAWQKERKERERTRTPPPPSLPAARYPHMPPAFRVSAVSSFAPPPTTHYEREREHTSTTVQYAPSLEPRAWATSRPSFGGAISGAS